MRSLSWLLILVCSIGVLAGCNSEAAPAPEDDAFQKQLSEAASKNKGKPEPSKRAGGAKLEDAQAKDRSAPGDNSAVKGP